LDNFGVVALLPFILSIFFLLWKQDVILSLLGGLFLGAVLVFQFNPLVGFINISGSVISNTLTNAENIYLLIMISESIILFSLLEKSGFLLSLRKLFTRWGKNDMRLQYLLFVSSSALFVERNLSALLIGIFSKPFVDSKSISTCKHAYLINTVGASLWTLVPISTFLPVGVAAIGSAFGILGISYSPLSALYRSLAFQYYNIFSLFVALTTVILKKEILFMRRCESVSSGFQPISFGLDSPPAKQRPRELSLYGGAAAIFIFVATAVLLLSFKNVQYREWDFGSYQRTFIIALFSGIIFLFLFSLIAGTISYNGYRTLKDRKGTLFLTMFYIILAMAMAVLARRLGLYSIIGFLRDAKLSYSLLPMLIFIGSSFVSFLSGSSLLTIATVTPLAVQITSLYLPHPLIIDNVMFASIAASFSGATFGDINSPLSPLFIISAASAESPVLGHFTSQTGYSLIAFFVTIIFGYLFFLFGLKPYLSISTGMLAIFVCFMMINRGENIFF
jgi:tetracycline resistance efflux pump